MVCTYNNTRGEPAPHTITSIARVWGFVNPTVLHSGSGFAEENESTVGLPWLTGWGYGVIMCVWFGPVLDRDRGGVDGYALYQIWSKPWYGFTTFPTIHNQDIFHSATYATLNYDAYHIFVPHLHRSQTLP